MPVPLDLSFFSRPARSGSTCHHYSPLFSLTSMSFVFGLRLIRMPVHIIPVKMQIMVKAPVLVSEPVQVADPFFAEEVGANCAFGGLLAVVFSGRLLVMGTTLVRSRAVVMFGERCGSEIGGWVATGI